MVHISRFNRYALLIVALFVLGLGLYLYNQGDIKADTANCSSGCGYIMVALNGIVDKVSPPGDVVASITILNPDGTVAKPLSSLESDIKTFIRSGKNVFDSSIVRGTAKIGPFTPKSGYTVVIGDLNSKTGSKYMLVDPATANQTANVVANQTTSVSYNLTVAGGGGVAATVTIFGGDKHRASAEKFGDAILTCGGQVFSETINFSTDPSASALHSAYMKPPAGICSLEVKNFDSNRFKYSGGFGNPATVQVTNEDNNIYFSFSETVPAAAAPSASPSTVAAQGGGSPSPSIASPSPAKSSPSPASAAKSSPSAKAKSATTKSAKTAKSSPSPKSVATGVTSPASTASPIASDSTVASPNVAVANVSPSPNQPKVMSQTAKLGAWLTGIGSLLVVGAVMLILH